MITAKQILEAYYDIYSPKPGESIPVFKNPSQKELLECGEFIRFFADAKAQKIYIWDGTKAIHRWIIWNVLGKGPVETDWEIKGEAERRGSRMWLVNGKELRYQYRGPSLLSKMKNYDWSWMNNYQIDMESVQKELLDYFGE